MLSHAIQTVRDDLANPANWCQGRFSPGITTKDVRPHDLLTALHYCPEFERENTAWNTLYELLPLTPCLYPPPSADADDAELLAYLPAHPSIEQRCQHVYTTDKQDRPAVYANTPLPASYQLWWMRSIKDRDLYFVNLCTWMRLCIYNDTVTHEQLLHDLDHVIAQLRARGL